MISSLQFDNSFVRELPADPVDPRLANHPRAVVGACYTRVAPTPVPAPRLLAFSREVAALIGLDEAACHTPEFAEIFAGNRLGPGMEPWAACYGGHQFGSWAGQLGDGRAISLGEVVAPSGRWELQLKGAGRTPYSRSADGRAVLRSSLREFLCSEAMHHLGVPTTRALSLVTTGEPVLRDLLYDGNPRHEPGAIVCRVAPSFVRFGNFEIFAARRDLTVLKALADHTVRTHFPELGPPSPEVYPRWFAEVCRRTAVLMAHWMRVGFVHGVMNTDNMSILGLTIDYGPYGWLEGYDPGWTPNITDAGGRRYRFGAQPRVAMWNLVQLANALVPLTEDPAPYQQALESYAGTFEAGYQAMMAAKLGLPSVDEPALEALFALLTRDELDMTLFFRGLARVPSDPSATDEALLAPIEEAWYAPPSPESRAAMVAWLRNQGEQWRAAGPADEDRRRAMDAVNPKYVLRNYLAQLAIDDAERGEPGKIDELLEVLRRPYDEQPGREDHARKRPEWARERPGCSMLSCSS